MAGETLTVRRCEEAEALAHLSRIFEDRKTDTTGGLCSAADQLRGAQCFAVLDGAGRSVGHYAVQTNTYAHGDEVVIIAASGSLPGADLVASLLPYLEKQASGAQALTVHTKRRALLAKLGALGFVCDGYILRKALP